MEPITTRCLDGAGVIGGGTVATVPASGRVANVGDYNGDGKADILWQNSDGSLSIWEMDGLTAIGGGSLWNPGSAWHVA